MKRHTVIILLFVLVLLNLSCVSTSFSVKDFVPLTNFEELNGLYSNGEVGDISLAFGLQKQETDTITTFGMEFLKNNQLRITYYAPNAKYENIYKVKYKKNHVKIILRNQIYPFFPIYFVIHKKWVRLGFNEKQQLTIQKYVEDMGWVLILAGGGSLDYTYHFTKLDE